MILNELKKLQSMKDDNGFYSLYWIPFFAFWGLLCLCMYQGHKVNEDIKKITSRKNANVIIQSYDL
jgi:cytosine/uracil/thiamine/allantoin permease